MKPPSKTRLDWLLSPSARISDRERIQRARLLSAVLLVLLALALMIIALVLRADPADISDPAVQGAVGLLFICAGMYGLNRSGYTTVAAVGLIAPLIALFIYIPFFPELHRISWPSWSSRSCSPRSSSHCAGRQSPRSGC